MDYELILDASDSDLFDDHSLVTESPPPLVNPVLMQPTTQPSRPRSTVRIPRHNIVHYSSSSSDRSPSPPPPPPPPQRRGRRRHRRRSGDSRSSRRSSPDRPISLPSTRRHSTAPAHVLTPAPTRPTKSDRTVALFPNRRAELDDYLSTILDLVLQFGSTGFYTYHFLFASPRLQVTSSSLTRAPTGASSTQNCRVFAVRSSLACELCGAPSHPASECVIAAPFSRPLVPPPHPPSVFSRLGPTAPPPPITPKPPNPPPAAMPLLASGSIPRGVDKKGRPFLYQGGRMICNNFNNLDCSTSSCRFLHTCSFCGGTHARHAYPHNPTLHTS
eukprot:superscaffoldBa00000052_g895